MLSRVEVYNPATVKAEADEHIEYAKRSCGACKEINCREAVGMVFEKRPPRLRGRFMVILHTFRDRGLGDLDARFE